MSAIPYDSPTQDRGAPEQEQPTTHGRPRRRWLNRKSAALAAVITCAAGFYGGVRVEKSQLDSTPTAAAPANTAGAGATGLAGPGAGVGARAGFAGGAARSSGNASFGTVSSVSGDTIYLTDSAGNTVKVTLSSATKITKSESASKSSVRPGDSVVIQGSKSSNGTVTATVVSDSGASAPRAGAGSTSTSTNSPTGG